MDSRVEIRPGRFLQVTIHKNPASDTTVFLIHGLGGRADQWRDQIRFLKNQYTIVVPDLLGQGKSDAPKSNSTNLYSFTELDQDLQALFIRYAGANNILLGHSYGGALATSVALDHQDKVNKLILISPVPCNPQVVIPFMYKLPTFIMELFRPLLEKKFRELAFSPNADPKLVAFELQEIKKNPMYVIKSLVQGMQKIPKIDLTMLNIPTLIITGEPDGLVSPVSQQEFYKGLPHHQFKIIDHSSHMSLLEKPELVNQYIANFLKIDI
jgi:abhydrolase domain-containing protein 8